MGIGKLLVSAFEIYGQIIVRLHLHVVRCVD